GASANAASTAAVGDESAAHVSDAAFAAPVGTITSTTPAVTTPAAGPPTSATAPTSSSTTTPTTSTATTPASDEPTSTTPDTRAPSKHSGGSQGTSTTTDSATKGTRESTQANESSSGSGSSKSTLSAATREANLASARAAVKSDELTVKSDEQAVQDTNLYAPESGTIVSLSGQVGEVVSGSGTTRASSSSDSSSGASGASATSATGAAARTGASASSSGSTGSSDSSSSSFAVLSDLSSMQLVVALSESEIGNVKVGQIATVTVEALSATKLAAHVSEVALLSTSSSGAVSYDVTFQLDQLAPGIKLGMSATAEVVVKQAEGINVPTSAITADTVTVERAGKQVRQRVVTGLAGNTSTIVLSGLKAGETVVLPAAATSSSATNLVSRLAGRTGLTGAGGGLGGGGGFAGAGGGGGAFFRGGG
ncbi:MAG TPA: hypothetical protein VK765_00480, partial [Solirubrobacteraceae bacterium]|nr:hypothetical protein [Solirubrobacteraceae bacterium]